MSPRPTDRSAARRPARPPRVLRGPRILSRLAARLAVLAAALAVALPAAAQQSAPKKPDTTPDRPPAASRTAKGVTIVDYGIYKVDVAGYTKAPGDVAGVRFNARNIRLIRHSVKILAQPHLVFGVRYRITDPALWGRRLRSVIVFPKMTNPKTGKSATTLHTPLIGRNTTDVMLFRFDFSWEMAEGIWFMRIYDGDRLVLEQRFKVIVALN